MFRIRHVVIPALVVGALVLFVGRTPDRVVRPSPVLVVDRPSVSAAPTTTVDELAVWQRAVWEVAVWEQATATTATTGTTGTVPEPEQRSNDRPQPTDCPPEIVAVIHDAFAGTGSEDWAVGIAWRESRCQPGATNPNGCCVDTGLFQLRLPIHEARVAGCDALDAGCNARGARSLFDEVGACPWDKAGGYC